MSKGRFKYTWHSALREARRRARAKQGPTVRSTIWSMEAAVLLSHDGAYRAFYAHYAGERP